MPQLKPIPIEIGRPARPALSEAHARLFADLAKARGRSEPGQACVFNQNRECFVALQAVAGDFPLAGLKNWLSSLSPNSGTGVLMIPFRGIVATDVTAPLDLLYLDDGYSVLDAVEFFPTFRVSPTSSPAASVLALPSHSVFASQTQRGDRLTICTLEEMEWHLDQLVSSTVATPAPPTAYARPSATSPAPMPPQRPVLQFEDAKRNAGPVLVREDANAALTAPVAPQPQIGSSAYIIPEPQVAAPIAAPTIPVAAPAPPENAGKPEPAKRSWLSKFLNPEPGDPRRKSNRKVVNGLAAHFFTGGAPHPHEVRDISPTGIYVVTNERWYPGTVIRMTLTKQEGGDHPLERSITIHAQSMRWGNDGVGLEFLLETRKSGRPPGTSCDAEQLGAFLKKLS